MTSGNSLSISIAILAGGRGLRLGGQDKGLACIQGQPLVWRTYQQLRPYSEDILLNANRHHDEYSRLLPECRLVSDRHEGFCGPLAGIHSSLHACRHDYLLTVPCDLLALPDDCVQQLQQAVATEPHRPAYAVINGQPVYPLCLVHKALLHDLDQHLLLQQLSVWRWLAAHHAIPVAFTMPAPHPVNLNTPALLAAAGQAGFPAGGTP